jgi:hypothetical protein
MLKSIADYSFSFILFVLILHESL